MTHRVRTTMQPDREIELSDAEYASLKTQGLLIEGREQTPEAAPAPAAAPAPTPTSGKRDKESSS